MANVVLRPTASRRRSNFSVGANQAQPSPSDAGTTVVWDTRTGGAQSIQGAANLAAALSAAGFGGSPTVTSPSTLEWDAADSLTIPGAPKVFKLTWTPDGTTEQQISLERGITIAANKDVYMQWKRFQAAGFDNTPGFGRKNFVWFQNDNPQVRYALTLNSTDRVRLFRDGSPYSASDPTTVISSDDGSRAEARWSGAGGTSNDLPVPGPSDNSRHPDNYIGQIQTYTCRIKGESAGGAGDGQLETWFNGVLCDRRSGLYTSNLPWSSAFQFGGPTWNYPASGPYTEAVWDFVCWHKAL